jgi:hypothetical protein
MSGPRKTAMIDLTWPDISRARSWIANESIANESFEKFYLDVILGEASWSANPAGPIRWHPDENDDGVYGTYKCGAGLENYDPANAVELWTGRWMQRIPRLVQVPT